MSGFFFSNWEKGRAEAGARMWGVGKVKYLGPDKINDFTAAQSLTELFQCSGLSISFTLCCMDGSLQLGVFFPWFFVFF